MITLARADTEVGAVSRGAVTILIPHYQTLESIRLCLRCLRKYTHYPYIVRVLDNGSADESIDYLRSLPWIELEERKVKNETWTSHYEALNEAVNEVTTGYFLALHSDVYVMRHGWLEYLLAVLNENDYSVVGAQDQAIPVPGLWRYFRGLHDRSPREQPEGVPIIRSLCALYRTADFKEAGSFFSCEGYEDVTYSANAKLAQEGFKVGPLPASRLCKYMFHSSATTRIANNAYHRDPAQHRRKHERFRTLPVVKEIMADDSLDR